jgi:hypothetical protein
MVGNIMVRKTKMLGSGNRHIFSAYEPSNLFGPHSAVTTEGGVWFGQIGTRRIGPEIEKLKGGSPEHIAACNAQRKLQAEEARAAILAAFPEAASGRLLWGDVAHEIELEE